MADLTSATASSVIGGVGAVTMQLLGMPPGALICGFIGAGFGVTLTTQQSRWQLLWAFAFSMFVGAGTGTWIADHFHKSMVVTVVGSLLSASLAVRAQAMVAGAMAPVFAEWVNKVRPKQP